MIRIAIPSSNLLIMALLGKDVNPEDVVLKTGWQWQRLPWVNYTGIMNTPVSEEEVGYALDRDIVDVVVKLNDVRKWN